MKKYGFFGGSFNPVTKAHVELAQEIVNKYKLDKVIFVPMGDNYNKKDLISEKHRYNMLKIATQKYEKLEVSDIELNKDICLTTLEAFCMIEEKYKDIDKYYIIGADNLNKIIESQDLDALIKNYKYIVIERNSIDCTKLIKANELLNNNKEQFIIMKNKKYNYISASKVRNGIKSNNNIEDILFNEVFDYIEQNNIYKNLTSYDK